MARREAAMELTIEGRNTPVLPEWRALVEEKLGGLTEGHDDVVQARVTVMKHPRHQRGHDEATLVLTVRGDLLKAHRKGDDVTDALYRAFEVMDREMKRYRDRRSDAPKPVGVRPRGVITSWFPELGYGFIRAEGDLEVYFHQRSVPNDDRKALAEGTQVEFEVQESEKGPWAARITVHR
jgi:CspA family cold shock protein